MIIIIIIIAIIIITITTIIIITITVTITIIIIIVIIVMIIVIKKKTAGLMGAGASGLSPSSGFLPVYFRSNVEASGLRLPRSTGSKLEENRNRERAQTPQPP